MGRFRSALVRWFAGAGRNLPWRHTRDPYAILVSEIMLQQTQAATVTAFFRDWMTRFPDVHSLAAAPEREVMRHWQGLGYYARARNLHRAARIVVDRHHGVFPQDPEQIRTLPGVGRYTAGAVASFAFDLPEPAVDTNIARVLARIAWIEEPVFTAAGSKKLWSLAARAASKNPRKTNSALMELGALVCLPRSPRCGECPVRGYCGASERGAPETLPIAKPRPKTVHLVEHCAWTQRGGRILLSPGHGTRWRGLWRLPRLECPPENTAPALALTYPITHHRVRLEVFRKRLKTSAVEGGCWFDLATLHTVPMPSPHRRAVVGMV